MSTTEQVAELQRQARIEARNVELATTTLGRKGAAYRLGEIQTKIWNLTEKGA